MVLLLKVGEEDSHRVVEKVTEGDGESVAEVDGEALEDSVVVTEEETE